VRGLGGRPERAPVAELGGAVGHVAVVLDRAVDGARGSGAALVDGDDVVVGAQRLDELREVIQDRQSGLAGPARQEHERTRPGTGGGQRPVRDVDRAGRGALVVERHGQLAALRAFRALGRSAGGPEAEGPEGQYGNGRYA
jgi:hypothetical protein